MRRSIFNARSAQSLARTFGGQQARRTFATPSAKGSQEQAFPLGPFYEAILNSAQPIPDKKPEVPPVTSKTAPPSPPIAPAPKDVPAPEPAAAKPAAAAPPPARRRRKPKENGKAKSVEPSPPSLGSETVNESSNDDPQTRARVIFGSSLAGPAERAERLAAIRSQSRLVTGVLVPPRPEEPDNCCMSGCVNCVWDRYRDDMEEWASANAEAERRLRLQERGIGAADVRAGAQAVDPGVMSIDDDGGRSITNWDMGASSSPSSSQKLWDEELYKNVPVGIREFMRQEKILKEKHLRKGTMGG